jgi:hypothetical protein
VLAGSNEQRLAVELLACVSRFREESGVISMFEVLGEDRLALVRAATAPEAFGTYWAAGSSWSMEHALELASRA